MRITQIMLARGFGGAERSFVDLSLALARRGHTVQAICHPNFVQQAQLRADPAIEVCNVNVRGSWDLLVARHIGQHLDAFQPDIVNGHLARAAHLTGKAVRSRQLPLVVKTHSYVNLKYYRAVDRFVATTPDQRNYLLAHNISPSRISVIPNFSSMPALERDNMHSSTPLVLVSYGRMVEKKGFDVLLSAVAKIDAAGLNVRLLLGGDGPQAPTLKEQAASLGLAGQVEFLGWVDDVEPLLRSADLFVLPSRREPFGIAILEAMAAHTPIVATRSEGPAQILDTATAFLVPVDDSHALAEQLRVAMTDPQLRSRKARASSALYQERYSADVVVPQYLALYAELASQV